jgi:NAD(P)-dependent dehydrogenase (short-subunit alcohol dehydrogenase family)
MDRCELELDPQRQPDVGGLGIEIFGPLIESHGGGGQIVSTASMAGPIAGAGPAYNVSKYGVVALSGALRVTLAPRGIGVSVLCPGFIRTQIMNSRRGSCHAGHPNTELAAGLGPSRNAIALMAATSVTKIGGADPRGQGPQTTFSPRNAARR